MSKKTDRLKCSGDVTHYAKVYVYPCGVMDILCSTKPIFREPGWEDAAWRQPGKHVLTSLGDAEEAQEDAPGSPPMGARKTVSRWGRRVRT